MTTPAPSAAVQTAIHFSNILHATTNPSLQMKYQERLRSHTRSKSLVFPKRQPEEFCSSCNSMLVPGFNVSIRIVYKRSATPKGTKAQEKPRRQRVLRYKCASCNFNNDFKNLLFDHDPRGHAEPVRALTPTLPSLAKDENKSAFKAEWQPAAKVDKQPSSKAKARSAKRKKMNNLQQLLKDKKQADQAKKSTGLNLMDFMK